MLISERLGTVPAYTHALVEVVNELGSAGESAEATVAMRRVLRALGVEVAGDDPPVNESEVKRRVADYVVALKGVLRAFRTAETRPAQLRAVNDLEKCLGGLL